MVWMLFPLAPAIAVSLGTIIHRTHGFKAGIGVLIYAAYQLRRGHRQGEGFLTRRYGDYPGMTIDGENSNTDLGTALSLLSEKCEKLKPFVGKLFELTYSEGVDLANYIAVPVMMLERLSDKRSLKEKAMRETTQLVTNQTFTDKQMIAYINRIDMLSKLTDEEIGALEAQIELACEPVVRFLGSISTARIRTLRKAA